MKQKQGFTALLIFTTATVVLASDGHQDLDDVDVANTNTLLKIFDRTFDGEEQEQHQRKNKQSKCKALQSCKVMGGACITDDMECNGTLVPNGCKKAGCQCCAPGNFSSNFEKLEKELKALKEIMEKTDSKLNSMNTNLGSELQGLEDIITQSESNLSSELESLDDTTSNMGSDINSKLNSMNSDINTKLESIIKKLGCPDGFFPLTGQCFRMFADTALTWSAAHSKCATVNSVLAKPNDPIALRRHLVNRHGSKYAWLDAKGTGSEVAWTIDGTSISSSSSLWWNGQPGSATTNADCLVILTNASNMASEPTKVYYMNHCNTGSRYAVCEYVRE